jgi:Mn2+/Fe2+ NRAMP family transporter
VSQTPIAPSSSTHAASSSSVPPSREARSGATGRLAGEGGPPSDPAGGVLDPPRGWLATASHLGPGLIISAAIVGSGELIVTPKVGAASGFSMLWFVIFACIVKVFVQIELARLVIVERVTTLEALNTIPGPRWRVSWILWFWLFMYCGLVFQVAGLIGGCVLVFQSMDLTVSPHLLLVAITASGAILLVTGRYKTVEVGSTLMVAMFTLSTVVAMIALQWTPYHVTSAQIAEGLRFHLPPSFTVAFAAFGVTGVGASELVYYPYWCLEKGYARHVGVADGSAAWRTRLAGWLRVLHTDATMSLVIYTGATIAFYILGAAVLHGQGMQVTDRQLIDTLKQMYEQTLGATGAWIFLVGAFAVLYSTFFVATASNARLLADAAQLFGLTRYQDDRARQRAVRAACVGLPIASGTVFFLFPQPVVLVLIGAVGQALMLPFIGGAAIYFHYNRLAGVIHSGPVWRVCLWLAALSMMLAGGYQLVQTLRPLL